MCPLTSSEGGLQLLYDVEDDALNWLKTSANLSRNGSPESTECCEFADFFNLALCDIRTPPYM